MKYMLSIGLVVFFISMLLSMCQKDVKHAVSALPLWEQELLQEDFDELTQIIRQNHSFLFVSETDFTEKARIARAQITDDMSVWDFYRIVKTLIANLDCGHSRGMMSEAMKATRKEAKFMPLQVSVTDQDARIELVFGEAVSLEGCELIQINGLPILDVLEGISPLISTDGGHLDGKTYIMSQWFSECYFEAFGSFDTFEIVVEDAEGQIQQVMFDGLLESDLEAKRQQTIREPEFALESIDGIGYITLPSFSYYEDDDFSAYQVALDDYFRTLQAASVEMLVIDIRGNWGGDPRAASYLLQYIAEEPFAYFVDEAGGSYYPNLICEQVPFETAFNGQVFLLTDGSCFSTAGHFTALFKYHEMGTIVGTRTAGGFACSDSAEIFELSNTEIRFSLSQVVYSVAVDDMTVGAGVMPDIYVQQIPNDVSTYLSNLP